MKKGFTLIELLIAITIIGILAVAFLPTLLGAPAKGRDTQRIADLNKIQKVLINYDLEHGLGYPTVSGATIAARSTGFGIPDFSWELAFAADFGGIIPSDSDPAKSYIYNHNPGGGNISFGLRANVEIFENANANCSTMGSTGVLGTPVLGTPTTWCYGILVK